MIYECEGPRLCSRPVACCSRRSRRSHKSADSVAVSNDPQPMSAGNANQFFTPQNEAAARTGTRKSAAMGVEFAPNSLQLSKRPRVPSVVRLRGRFMKKLSIISTLVLILSTGFASAQTTPAPLSDRAAARFLDQATWGPNAASIAQLQQMGIENWLAQQFALNTSDLPDQQILNTQGKSNNNLIPVQVAFFNNAVNQPDQLRQRVAFILSQIWVVSAVQIPQAYAYPPYWRIFRDNAFGNYRDIIKAVTLSPAMGSYLNVANNNKANAAKGTAANRSEEHTSELQ